MVGTEVVEVPSYLAPKLLFLMKLPQHPEIKPEKYCGAPEAGLPLPRAVIVQRGRDGIWIISMDESQLGGTAGCHGPRVHASGSSF